MSARCSRAVNRRARRRMPGPSEIQASSRCCRRSRSRRRKGPQRPLLRSFCGPQCQEQPGTGENCRPRAPVFSRMFPRVPGCARTTNESGRQDLNLRPPGPQPGALPDCATPRGRWAFYGEAEALPLTGRSGRRELNPLSKLGRLLCNQNTSPACSVFTLPAALGHYRRSSTGTSPASSVSPGGGHGPNQLSRAPSSVTVEPLKAAPRGEASSATSHACSATVPVR
jgi:hypothetical protein